MKLSTVKRSIFSAITLFMLTSAPALASIITLDNIPLNFRDQNLPSYDEGDYNVSASCTNCSNVFSTLEANAGYGASTGAIAWGASGRFLETWNTSVIFTLTNNTGSLFNLHGFNIGWFNNSVNDANWSVRTYDSLGNLVADDDYLGKGSIGVNYLNVQSIQFQNNGGFSSFDNLNVSVPEPGALALFGLALLGLGYSKRLSKRA